MMLRTRTRLILSYLLGTLFIALAYWAYHTYRSEKELLVKEGVQSKALVIKKSDVQRGVDYTLRYNVGGKQFQILESSYQDFNVGDSIEIVYDPKDPEICWIKYKLED